MIGIERTKILILDGNQRSALAATRALGKKGLCVVVADDMARTLAGSSGYCSERLVYPSPYVNPRGFIDAVKEEVIRRGIGVIFPMTDLTTQLLTERREEFTGISIPCATREAFEAVTDKWALMELAKKLAVLAPVTRLVRSREDMRDAARQIGFPLVMKTCRSKIQSHDRWIATSVEYACSMQDLERMATSNEAFRNHSFLLQERIEGQGQGIFALYDHGKPVAFFAHRRLREKPPSGGVSVLSESVKVDPQLRDMSRRILDHVGWHGVAMVEFKVSRNGVPYLIEINGRFWGSLQLAIDAGVNFPYLLLQIATGQRLAPHTSGYRIGVKSRWLLGDLDHLLLRLFKPAAALHLPEDCPSKLQSLVAFCRFFQHAMHYEILHLDDPKPFGYELRQYVSNVLRGSR